MSFSSITATSEPTFTFEPHHSTCLQNNDLPSLTNGIASLYGMTQLSLNSLFFNNSVAPNIVKATPPSIRIVANKCFPMCIFLILPVLLEYTHRETFVCDYAD